jgi:hypothetical protein
MIDTSGANCFDARRWRRIADLSTSPGACRPVENHSVDTEPIFFPTSNSISCLKQDKRLEGTRPGSWVVPKTRIGYPVNLHEPYRSWNSSLITLTMTGSETHSTRKTANTYYDLPFPGSAGCVVCAKASRCRITSTHGEHEAACSKRK